MLPATVATVAPFLNVAFTEGGRGYRGVIGGIIILQFLIPFHPSKLAPATPGKRESILNSLATGSEEVKKNKRK